MANECHKELKVSFTQAFIGLVSHQPRNCQTGFQKLSPLTMEVKPLNFPFCFRFFTEDECIGTCKDAKRTNKKKVVCPHAAPICGVGCVLGKPEDNDEGTCLTCICNKKPEGEFILLQSKLSVCTVQKTAMLLFSTLRTQNCTFLLLADVLRDKREQVVSGHRKKVTKLEVRLLYQQAYFLDGP